MLRLLVGGRDESSDESKIRHALHGEAGTLPGLYLHLRAHVRTPTRRNRHAAPFPRQPAFGPPDDRHPRTKRFAPVDRRTTAPDRLLRLASPFVVQAGKGLPPALLTSVR